MSSLKSFFSWLVGGALFFLGICFLGTGIGMVADGTPPPSSITICLLLAAVLLYAGRSLVHASKQVEAEVQVKKKVRTSTIERQDQMLITIKNQLERGEIKATDLPPNVLERLIMGD